MRISDWSSDVCSSDLFETDVLGMRVTGNAGVRYAKTDQSSSGFNSGTFVTVDRSYDDWLPSFNLNLHPTDNIILRGAIAKVITRPTLGSLTPGGSVDQFNFRSEEHTSELQSLM